jgi:hypothetical protein
MRGNAHFMSPENGNRPYRLEWRFMADSRRSGDEIRPWLLNGDLRPFLVTHDVVIERPLRG